MPETINCNGCSKPHDKSALHYDPKKGVARFYCDKCYARKNSFTSLQVAKRNNRNSAARINHSRKHY